MAYVKPVVSSKIEKCLLSESQFVVASVRDAGAMRSFHQRLANDRSGPELPTHPGPANVG